MELLIYLILFLFVLIISTTTNKLLPFLPLPLVQILLGIGIGLFVPNTDFHLNTELFLAMVIGPLLFREAEEADITSILKHWRIVVFLIFPVIFTCVRIILGGTLGQNKLAEARKQARYFLSGFFLFGIFIGICEACSVILIPFVFIQLSPASHTITRNLVWVIALYMPLWSYLNTQFAVSRAGGDALLGAWVDISVNLLVFLPGMYVLTFYTSLSPVAMFGLVKLSDFLKLIIAAYQLKKERWVKNLTTGQT